MLATTITAATTAATTMLPAATEAVATAATTVALAEVEQLNAISQHKLLHNNVIHIHINTSGDIDDIDDIYSEASSSSGSSSNTNNTNNTLTLATSFDFADMDVSKMLIVATSVLLILVTVVGNTLVILSVLTTRRLRTVTNCFVMNLAVTDWLVGTCVMPPAVIRHVVGSWQFGWILCDIWISLDVLLCTGSILSLCAISLDRYLAVTQPLTYSKKRRSKRLALLMILIVWVTALSITCPPYLGWYEPERRQEGHIICRYNQNKGYVVFSAMGSFFIPLSVMLYVYLRIGYVLTSRRQRMMRDANSERSAADNDIDGDKDFLSESEQLQCLAPRFPSLMTRWGSNHSSQPSSLKCSKCHRSYTTRGPCLPQEAASFYELVEIPRLSLPLHGVTASRCKYSASGTQRANTLPLQTVHLSESRPASFSTTCLPAGRPHTLPHANHANRAQPHRVAMRISTTKRETKTAKTLTIVMGGFIACWLPFFTYYIVMPFLPPAAVCEGLMSFLTWVGWVNCGINPFIYAFYNPDFRTAFWRLTCRRICKQQPAANRLAMFRG